MLYLEYFVVFIIFVFLIYIKKFTVAVFRLPVV